MKRFTESKKSLGYIYSGILFIIFSIIFIFLLYYFYGSLAYPFFITLSININFPTFLLLIAIPLFIILVITKLTCKPNPDKEDLYEIISSELIKSKKRKKEMTPSQALNYITELFSESERNLSQKNIEALKQIYWEIQDNIKKVPSQNRQGISEKLNNLKQKIDELQKQFGFI